MPKTVTKRCILCRALVKWDRKQTKTDRMEMRKRDGIKRAGRAVCQRCFDYGPSFVAQG